MFCKREYECTITGVLIDTYDTSKPHSSDYISCIQFDDSTVIDPDLTATTIKMKKINDFDSVMQAPNYLIIDSINYTLSSTEGTFTINGRLPHIPLTYPPGLESVCLIPISKNKNKINVESKFSGTISSELFMFEKRPVWNYHLLFSNYQSKGKITAINGELLQS